MAYLDLRHDFKAVATAATCTGTARAAAVCSACGTQFCSCLRRYESFAYECGWQHHSAAAEPYKLPDPPVLVLRSGRARRMSVGFPAVAHNALLTAAVDGVVSSLLRRSLPPA